MIDKTQIPFFSLRQCNQLSNIPKQISKFDNEKLLIQQQNSLSLYDFNMNKEIKNIPLKDLITSTLLTQDNQYLYIAFDNGILTTWDFSNNMPIFTFKIHDNSIFILNNLKDSQFLFLGLNNDEFLLFSIQSQIILKKVKTDQIKITKIQIWENFIITSGYQTIKFWLKEEFSPFKNLKIHKDFINQFQILNKKLKLISCCSQENIKIIDLQTFEIIRELDGNPKKYFCVDDKEEFLYAIDEQSVSLWNIDNGTKIGKIQQNSPVSFIQLIDNPQKLLIFTDKQELKIYEEKISKKKTLSTINSEDNLSLQNVESLTQSVYDEYKQVKQYVFNKPDPNNVIKNLQIQIQKLIQEKNEQQEKIQAKGTNQNQQKNLLDDLVYFKGEIIENKKNGICKEILKNGEMFMGNYQNDIREGPGEIQQNDQIISGNFVNNNIQGNIFIEDKKTGISYEGICNNYKSIEDVNILAILKNKMKYEKEKGIIDKNTFKFTGIGFLTFENGIKIFGSFKDDILTYSDSNLQQLLYNQNQKLEIISIQENLLKTKTGQVFFINYSTGSIEEILMQQINCQYK